MIVAIDGPAGSGKTTTARRVAELLGFVHIDTGAMYRAVTLQAIRQGVSLDDDAALADLAGRSLVELGNADGVPWVRLDGEDVAAAIRTPEVDLYVSRVSEVEGVREQIVDQQRRMAEHRGVVMEGRDIGTVVLPEADVKVFVTASAEERAHRRQRQLREQGMERDFDEILCEQQQRDERDSTRPVAPLRQAPDAHKLVTDDMTEDEVVDLLAMMVGEAAAGDGER